MRNTLEMQTAERDGKHLLCSPEVGWFTCALSKGAVVAAGEHAGTILALGRSFELCVPAGVAGLVVNEPPAAIRHPVGYGDVLYELAPLEGARIAARRASESAARVADDRVLRATQSGRYYHRPAPGEPAFVTPGTVVRDGTPVGLIEVMKTFSQVAYRATSGLPPVARVVRLVAADGADVRVGDVLLEIERAEG